MVSVCGSDELDLPALERIEVGKNAFRFRENEDSSTLVLRSGFFLGVFD